MWIFYMRNKAYIMVLIFLLAYLLVLVSCADSKYFRYYESSASRTLNESDPEPKFSVITDKAQTDTVTRTIENFSAEGQAAFITAIANKTEKKSVDEFIETIIKPLKE